MNRREYQKNIIFIYSVLLTGWNDLRSMTTAPRRSMMLIFVAVVVGVVSFFFRPHALFANTHAHRTHDRIDNKMHSVSQSVAWNDFYLFFIMKHHSHINVTCRLHCDNWHGWKTNRHAEGEQMRRRQPLQKPAGKPLVYRPLWCCISNWILYFFFLFNFHKYFPMAQDGTIEQTWSTFSSCYGCVIWIRHIKKTIMYDCDCED